MNIPLFITGSGLVGPAPGNQAAQAAALLSGAPLFERHPKWIGGDGRRQVMGFVNDLHDMQDFPLRVATLLHRAFSDCRADRLAHDGDDHKAIPMIVLLPELLQTPAFQNRLRQICRELNFSGVSEMWLHFGSAPLAASLLQQVGSDDRWSGVYIAAADRLATPFVMDFLAAQGMLCDRQTSWGIVPPEATA